MSARYGDNVSELSEQTPWYKGPTLIAYLETIDVSEAREGQPFRLPVQWVNRPNLDFRGYCGTIAGGSIRVGEPIVVAASGRATKVRQIYRADELVEEAVAGDAVTLTLADEVDIARGDVLARPEARPDVADQFSAHVIWMSADPMLPGRSYFLKLGARLTPASITELKHRVDVNSRELLAAKTLALNEIGLCNLSTTLPVAFDPYETNHDLGGFILIDRRTNETAAAGVIAHSLRRATNVHRHDFTVTREAHAEMKHQKPAVLWFTGLSGAGKSTIANIVERKLQLRGVHTSLLDGDNVRHGLNKDLGFTPADRVENIRRIAEVARLMTDAGLIVLTSFISPFRAERRLARDTAAAGEFIEIYVDTTLDTVIARDTKGLYKRARRARSRISPASIHPTKRRKRRRCGSKPAAGAEELADRVIAELEAKGRIAKL